MPDDRHSQRFPTLSDDEIARTARFGTRRCLGSGANLFRTGETGVGLFVLISGRVAIERHDASGHFATIADHRSGAIIGEVAGLLGRPALVDGTVIEDSEVIVINPAGLRALLVGEAELGEHITRALILRRVDLLAVGAGGPILIAPKDNAASLGLANFLTRNGWPFLLLDPATDSDAADIVAPLHLQPSDLPIAVLTDGTILRAPDEATLARALGMIGAADPGRIYDVAIVGAGPAGLAASVYAASEGLSVLVLDKSGFGGQAGASARIENYFGFPTGITGQALTARGFVQAQKFGVEIAIPTTVTQLECGVGGTVHSLHAACGRTYRARSVVIASGARYRRPLLANICDFEGRGVWYWASILEAKFCAGQEVLLVGGGNSAGQAAVYLASFASKVRIIVRSEGLEATMSRYLVDRIAANPKIEIMPHTEVAALRGDTFGLNEITWRNRLTLAETTAPIRNLFLFIGADPASEWLSSCGITLDKKGFVVTEPGNRSTDYPGIFAIGDVRSTSVKRVGGAIGEGAAVAAEIHAYLASLHPSP